jgi:hypothetical protein
MDNVLSSIFDGITTFDPQNYKNMTVVGLDIPENRNIDLMSLKIGFDLGLVEICEVDEKGSVNEVKVINKAVTPLLILDGEEIIGSKQNRIVNSTIIIEAKSEKIIPVSCTEAGRWEYNTSKFHYSKHMASSNVRKNKLHSVSNSLRLNNKFNSNQSEVWNNISQTEEKLNVHSQTGALNDAYKNKSLDLEEYSNSFKIHDKQNGFIVYINGRLVGMEMIYNNRRYNEYHDKLLESYIIDAISKSNDEYENDKIKDDEFIEEIKKSECESFDSVGLGVDYRLENENISGSAVLFKDALINASFFRKV